MLADALGELDFHSCVDTAVDRRAIAIFGTGS
eukprot:SAG31_NODE_33298_length_345_cov_1.044715_1_plen_31_part_01